MLHEQKDLVVAGPRQDTLSETHAWIDMMKAAPEGEEFIPLSTEASCYLSRGRNTLESCNWVPVSPIKLKTFNREVGVIDQGPSGFVPIIFGDFTLDVTEIPTTT